MCPPKIRNTGDSTQKQALNYSIQISCISRTRMSYILDFTVRASETVGEDFSFDVIFDEYEIKNKLGEGGFGSVV